MNRQFADHLNRSIKRTQLSVRQVAIRAKIPRQTLFNWLKGARPRWYPSLLEELRRLAAALELSQAETSNLLALAGYLDEATLTFYTKENTVKSQAKLPLGWISSGIHPAGYEMILDPQVTYQNKPSATIKAISTPNGFGTLCQTFKADAYRGKRMRFSAKIRSLNIEGWAGLWMRVDGPEKTLAFDNMQNRAITGTSDWNTAQIVLDISCEAQVIAFGILMEGAGQAWIADARFEAVDLNIPTTDLRQAMPDQPVNLDFSS